MYVPNITSNHPWYTNRNKFYCHQNHIVDRRWKYHCCRGKVALSLSLSCLENRMIKNQDLLLSQFMQNLRTKENSQVRYLRIVRSDTWEGINALVDFPGLILQEIYNIQPMKLTPIRRVRIRHNPCSLWLQLLHHLPL